MSMPEALDVEAIIGASHADREQTGRRRARLGLAVSALVTIVWLVAVTAAGLWDRVAEHWASAVTMIFGSFVAGSTPQGGGAVAFPVFTKVLEIPAEVARSFSLAIQSVGMGAASASILLNRRPVEHRAIAVAFPAVVVGFVAAWLLVSDNAEPFSPAVLPGPYVKVAFTLMVAAMAFVTWLGWRVQLVEKLDKLPPLGPRLILALVACGLFGGLASGLVGSGADVALYLGLVVLAGMSPRVGVATSVLLMTLTSFLGLILFGFVEGHLFVSLAEADLSTVTEVTGRPVRMSDAGTARFASGNGLPAGRFDLFGLWLAAVPVVAWGAPLGAFVSSRVTDRQLVTAVVVLALVEVISTIVFLDALRSDLALVAFGIVGLVVSFGGLWWLSQNRRRILGLPPLAVEATLTRSRLDVGSRFRETAGKDQEQKAEDG